MSNQVKEIAFIYYCVTDVARARRFYEQLLGLKVGLEYEGAPGTWEIEWLILLRFSAPLEEEESDRLC